MKKLMERDIAKATQELLDRLRRSAPPPSAPKGVADQPASHVYINAPKDCVIYIAPPATPKQDTPPSSSGT